jgi:acetate kinase
MGLTPLEGLIMGTRSGDLDPAIVDFIANKENISADEVNTILNKKSGVAGISGVSSDFRDLDKAAVEGNEKAQLALDMFNYRVVKYIGAYAAALDGVDAIVFTAGVGENNSLVRKNVTSRLGFLGVKLDEEKNNIRGEELVVSTDDSKVKVVVIPTNEELAIARETVDLV